jgi:hypothetical protein
MYEGAVSFLPDVRMLPPCTVQSSVLGLWESLTAQWTPISTDNYTAAILAGGIRTMALVHTYPFSRSYPTRWKRIRNSQRGTVFNPLVSIADWFPTLADAAGLDDMPAINDGSALDDVANGISQHGAIFLGQEVRKWCSCAWACATVCATFQHHARLVTGHVGPLPP